MNFDELTWENINFIWKYNCESVFENFFEEISFHIFQTKNASLIGYTDWWPKEDFLIKVNTDKLEISASMNIYDSFSGVGVRRTTEMLWDYNDDAEAKSLILIGAYLWQINTRFPDKWCGKPAILVRNMLRVVLGKMNEKKMRRWHGTTKITLPTSYTFKGELSKIGQPDTKEKLLSLISLENMLSATSHVLVRFEPLKQ